MHGNTEKKQPVVLVVDDEEQMRLLVRVSLEQTGFRVEEARDGIEALSAFERRTPDIVLLDVLMPGIDGFTVCERIKNLPCGERTPILMMTGLDDVQSINRAYEAGATDFITKPINWTILGHRVRYILRSSMAADRLRRSEANNRAMVDAIPDLMFRVRRDGTILDYIPAKNAVYPFLPAEVAGRKLHDVYPELARETMRYVEIALSSGDIQTFEYTLSHRDGVLYCEARIVVSGEDEALTIVRDITKRKKAEKHIRYLAYYDTLTGLPNRLYFKEKLEEALQRAKRTGRRIAVFFLDIDRFKRINDTLGHNAGDMLLKGVAGRLEKCLRRTDSITHLTMRATMGTVSRIGGDEFIVLAPEIDHVQDAAKVATRMLHELSSAFNLKGYEVFVTASIGITIYPVDGEDVDTILKNADTAMYHAKDLGRNNYQFYNQSMNATAFERLALENSLRKALERGEFALYYQPQINIESGMIVGMEALIRWMHPDLGMVSPSQFIPIAEEMGLIIPIGEWALMTACKQMKKWSAAGYPEMIVAVNLSSYQFRQAGFADSIAAVLDETGIPARCLKLELTESVIMQNIDETIDTLYRLKSMGIGLLIDDFGTGYSSLSYLKRFPIDGLKIDGSFVKDLIDEPDDAAITRTIIAMAHTLNLKVIAEGVETEEQKAFLRENGCEEMQGYLFSPPLPAEEVENLFGENGMAGEGN